VLNCIQLALYPQRLAKAELHALYLHGIKHLSRRRRLKAVLEFGMDEQLWLSLATALIDFTNDRQAASLTLKTLLVGSTTRDRKRALEAIRKAIRGGSPVLVRFGGAMDHYTALSGFTDQRFLLFDSSELKWVAAARISLAESSARPHWISRGSVFGVFENW
jgi:CO dehydrogenase/acetyl-CoA synthase gamma subunit (corrinoid Fe-S protein)